jgi:hypothetical protein
VCADLFSIAQILWAATSPEAGQRLRCSNRDSVEWRSPDSMAFLGGELTHHSPLAATIETTGTWDAIGAFADVTPPAAPCVMVEAYSGASSVLSWT